MDRTNSTVKQQLIELLRETAPAHHRAFQSTDGEDPEWPLWYANYMQERVQAVMNAHVTKSKLVQLLVSAAEEQEAKAPGTDWAMFYADYFLANYPRE